MSECVVRMEMPHVCITDNGYYGYCPMDRIWCIQRNAPPDITMREAYEAMTDKIPSWCPIICQLPEGHGDLVDWRDIENELDRTFRVIVDDGPCAGSYIREYPQSLIEQPIRVRIIVPAEAERSE